MFDVLLGTFMMTESGLFQFYSAICINFVLLFNDQICKQEAIF